MQKENNDGLSYIRTSLGIAETQPPETRSFLVVFLAVIKSEGLQE